MTEEKIQIGWSQLVFNPDENGLEMMATHWGWCLGENFRPLIFSIFGDIFYESASGGVYWLDIGRGAKEKIANDEAHFKELLGTEKATEWFMPGLVAALYRAGKLPQSGECYCFHILPIFAEGKYEPDNLVPRAGAAAYQYTGVIHRQIATGTL